jgi:hypothetical protein
VQYVTGNLFNERNDKNVSNGYTQAYHKCPDPESGQAHKRTDDTSQGNQNKSSQQCLLKADFSGQQGAKGDASPKISKGRALSKPVAELVRLNEAAISWITGPSAVMGALKLDAINSTPRKVKE